MLPDVKRALAGENVIGAKTGRNRHHLFQAQPEQRRTREQNKSERDLRDDEAVAKALRGATHRARARFRLERIREMAAQVEPGDRHRDDDSEKHRRPTSPIDASQPSNAICAPSGKRFAPRT